MWLVEVAKKITRAQLKKFLAHPGFIGLHKVAPAYDLITEAALSPGRVATTRLGVRPGRYLVFAYSFPDTATLERGQVRLITVLG